LSRDKQGKSKEAAKAYGDFLDAWSHADRDLPSIKAAQTYLARASNIELDEYGQSDRK